MHILHNIIIIENFFMHTIFKLLFCVGQEISGKNSEIMAEVGKARAELEQKIQRLEAERKSKSELYDDAAKLERQLNGACIVTSCCLN